MPNVVVPPGFAQCSWIFSLSNDPEEMMFTCGLDVDGYGGDAEEAAEDAAGAFSDAFVAGSIGNSYTYKGTRISFGQDGGDGPIAEFQVSIAGTASIGTLPVNVAILTRKLTALGGRRNRGRMFWPPWGFSETDVSVNGLIDSADLATWQTKMDDFYGNLVTGGVATLQPVLFHSGLPSTPTVITGFQTQQLAATMRRRLRP